MKKCYKPYGLDMNYEWKTYKHVGRNYVDWKNANLGMIKNLIRFFRKHNNKDEKKYAFCNTYSEWKRHVEMVLQGKTSTNYEDMLHWLYWNRNNCADMEEVSKVVMVPIYLTLLTIYDNCFIYDGYIKFIFLIASLIFITVISVLILSDYSEKTQFYEDFINEAEHLYNNITGG